MCRLALFLLFVASVFARCAEKNTIELDPKREMLDKLIVGKWVASSGSVTYNNVPKSEWELFSLLFVESSGGSSGTYQCEEIPAEKENVKWTNTGTWSLDELGLASNSGTLFFDEDTDLIYYFELGGNDNDELYIRFFPEVDNGRVGNFDTGWEFKLKLQPSGN